MMHDRYLVQRRALPSAAEPTEFICANHPYTLRNASRTSANIPLRRLVILKPTLCTRRSSLISELNFR